MRLPCRGSSCHGLLEYSVQGTAEIVVARGWGFNLSEAFNILAPDGYELAGLVSGAVVPERGAADGATPADTVKTTVHPVHDEW